MLSENLGFPAYRKRAIDTLISRRLQVTGAVILEGPRACGKTMTGLHHAHSAHFLDTDESLTLAQIDPAALLAGDPPILLDEWQVHPSMWNRVRRAVDQAGKPGQFILTGSAVPADDATRHTGAGRIMRLRMHTLTTAEKGLSSKTVSLQDLTQGRGVDPSTDQTQFDDVLSALVTSGFPAQSTLDPKAVRPVLAAYLEEVTRTDVGRVENLRADPVVLDRVLRSVARNVANEASWDTLAKDARCVAPNLATTTVARYVSVLKRLFIVDEVPAFSTELRSRARLRKAGKYHLADPALAAVALNAGPTELKRDLATTGYIFESAVIHDLAVYAQGLDAKLWHYRDSYGHEIDAVLTFPDGGWAGIEIKLGAGQIEAGAASLKKAASQISGPPPKFLAIITGTGYTANLSDQLVTFPLSALHS